MSSKEEEEDDYLGDLLGYELDSDKEKEAVKKESK